MTSIHERLNAGTREVLSEAAHPDIKFRADRDAAWAPIVGDATFHPDRPEMLGFSEDDKAEMLPNAGTLKVAEEGTELPVGYHVQALSRNWAVMGISIHNGKRVYRVKRMVPAPGEQAGADLAGGR